MKVLTATMIATDNISLFSFPGIGYVTYVINPCTIMRLAILSIILVLFGCDSANSQQPVGELPFRDVTETNLDVSGLGSNTMDAAVVDIDLDGDPDIILAIEFGPNIILINDGQGAFTNERTRLPTASHDSEDIAIADFDSDGDPDIIFVSEDDQTNEYYWNNGDGTFQVADPALPTSGTSNAVETADIDQDGDPDVIIGNAGNNVVLINNGEGVFTDESADRLEMPNSTTQDIELTDVDGDGDLDLIEANETANTISLNDGNGFFTYASDLLPEVVDQTREVDLGDIDNDGDPDIFFANVDFGGFGNPQNRLLLNDGSGRFTEITDRLPSSAFRTVDADFVDLNNDGFLDLLSGNRFNGNEKLVLINTNEGFVDQTESYFPSIDMYVFDFQVADFNQDGIKDIYLCGFRGEDKLFFGTGTSAK